MSSNYPDKIALFVPSLHCGGVERVMLNLARGFTDHGFKVDLVLSKAQGEYLGEVPINMRVVDLDACRVLASLPGLVKYLRRERPRAILSAMEHANVICILAAYLAKRNTRVIVSVHSTFSQSTNKRSNWVRTLMPFLVRIFYPYAYKIIFVSEAAKKDFIDSTKLNSKRVRVVYNPIITPELYEKSEKQIHHPWFAPGTPPVILGIGRLIGLKDFSTLIRAYAIVRKKCYARLIILGEGEERPKLESLIKELGIGKDVDLPGFVENPYTFIAHAKVFVLSSLTEGLPTVLVEALAIGTPVISTNCQSGPREILLGGKYGALVPVGDIKAMANKILECISESRVWKTTTFDCTLYELNGVVERYIAELLD